MLNSKFQPNNIHISSQLNSELIIVYDKSKEFKINTGREKLDQTVAILRDPNGTLITFSSDGTIIMVQPIKKIAHYLYDMIMGLCYELPIRPIKLQPGDQTTQILINLGDMRVTMSLPVQIHWTGDQTGIKELNEHMAAYDKLQVMR